MRRIKPAILLGIASMILVVAFVVWDSPRTSPGALSAVHARIAGIEEADCAACHGDGQVTMAQACGKCHAAIEQQIAAKTGLHGKLKTDVSRCGTCHVEHHGTDIQLAGTRSFALAGVASRDEFKHETLDFRLTGAHSALTCKQCHEHADDVLLAKDCTRFGGKAQRCASCHEDPHAGKLPDCAACHGQEEAFAKVARFQHPESFELTGAHATPGCLACHPKDSPFAVEASVTAGGKVQITRDSRSCEQCHASPHEKGFLARVIGAVGAENGMECATCHAVENRSFHAFDAKMPKELHALTGFALDPPHADVRCAKCHAPNEKLAAAPDGSDATASFHALHPRRIASDCKACHVDPHRGQFDTGLFAGKSCSGCHEPLAFVPPAFGIPEHAHTSFPLTGAHEAVACSACHAKTQENGPRRFAGTPTDCAGCHADAHAGAFDRVVAETMPRAKRADCALCHTTDSFTETSPPFDHRRWTSFALRGEHAKLECSSCHQPSAVADASGRTFGRVSDVFRGSPSNCSTCHADVHAGAFDKAKQSDCARCHTEEGFDGARKGFDHALEASFALTGAHKRASCESCHVPRARADAHDRKFGVVAETFPGPVTDCRTCHVDPHGNTFDATGMPAEVDGKRGCLRCHTTEKFDVADTTFDHGRWTGFALDGAHASTSCASCHATSGDERATFAPAKGNSCQACHEDPHAGQFAKRNGTDCARCHTVTTDFHALRFDHQRDTQFALDATHKNLACSKCHVEEPLDSGRKAVRYKPLGTSCSDCHDSRGVK